MVGRGRRFFRIGLIVIAVASGGLALWLRPWQRSTDRVSRKLLEQAVEVLATTENGRDFRAAIAGWRELLEARPEDRDLLLNQAVTVLKWISDTSAQLASGAVADPQQERALTLDLQAAYAEADEVLNHLSQASSSHINSSLSNASEATATYLEAALIEARARTLPYPDDITLRKMAAEKLLAALGQAPDQPLLAMRLSELAEELQADWPEVAPRATEAALQAWRAQPRNLALLVRTGESLLAQKDKRLLEVLDASIELAQPLLSMLPGAKQLDPQKLSREIRAAVEAEDWAKAQRIRAWFNLLRSSTAFRSDNRLINPDILALLDATFLERWREHLPESLTTERQPSPVAVTSQTLEQALAAGDGRTTEVALAAWYDADVDRDFDILTIRGSQLRITPWQETGPAPQATELALPLAPRGLCLADLWSVDSPQRPRKTQPSATAPANGTSDAATDTAAGAAAAVESSAHDTLQEVILWDADRVAIVTRRLKQATEEDFSVLESVPGLSSLRGVQHIAPLDVDSDGDLDLAVATDSGMQLLQNNGNRTFEDISQYSTLPPAGSRPTALVACDFDRDMDTDLVVTSPGRSAWGVLENILHSQFRFRAFDEAAWIKSGDVGQAAVAEFDGNASWDWCGLAAGKLSGVLTRTTAPGATVARAAFEHSLPESARWNVLRLADVNLDGHPDACVAGSNGAWCYFGDGTSLAKSPQPLLERSNVTQMDVQDADGDGRLDVLAIADDQLKVLRVAPAADSGPRHTLEVRVRGISDINGGGRINHFAIGSVLEVWSDGHYQARVIQSPLTHFGLADRQADNLRIVFNNGLTQNVLAPPTDTLIEERQELRGSCPFVYGWSGERFELITDLLWNAPLGLQVARGQVLPDRRWEHLLLPGRLLQPRDGAIELRITEELWEVAYFDHVALTAVDHPASVEVWTNEKVGPAELAQPRLFLASQPIRPRQARSSTAPDCLQQILTRDRNYVQPFGRQLCQGLCEPHYLELQFDPRQLARRSDVRLVLSGWMTPTDTSLNMAIAQNPQLEPPAPPSLWVPDDRGEFQCVRPFAGFPGGKPKTIVVDISGVLNEADPRLRIAGSQQIYWDEAYLIADEPPAPCRTERLELRSADLHFRGFSQLMPRTSDQPHWYDYAHVSKHAKWPPLEGLFTRYGDVQTQIDADDDRLVIMSSGDELIMRFQPPKRPLPDGWQRDYVLHSVGWDKDADINTLEGQSSLPLPFAAMRSYPPPAEQQPESQRVWQSNAETLTERPLFERFWHPDMAHD